jgi:hypothetical protein
MEQHNIVIKQEMTTPMAVTVGYLVAFLMVVLEIMGTVL